MAEFTPTNNPIPPFDFGSGTPKVSLPGVVPEGTAVPPLPALPNTVQVGPRPVLPASWDDAGRIAADVLRLYSENPEEAREIWAFAKLKLAKIAAEKAQ